MTGTQSSVTVLCADGKYFLYVAVVHFVELLRFCKFGFCTLRKDNPFFKAKYDYARDSDFVNTLGFKL